MPVDHVIKAESHPSAAWSDDVLHLMRRKLTVILKVECESNGPQTAGESNAWGIKCQV